MNDELIKKQKFFYDLSEDETFCIETFKINTKLMTKELPAEDNYYKYLDLFKNGFVKK